MQALGEELPQELQRGGVHPVQILDDEQDRLPRGARVQPLQHGPKGLFTLPDRRQRQRRVAIRGRERQQRRPQRDGLGPGQIVLFQAVQHPVEPGLRRFLAVEGEGPFVEVDGRIESRVLEMRRAAPLDDGCVHFPFDHLSQDVLLHRVDQARLAQARLADQQDDLPHALLGLLPAIREQADLLIAAGQRRELRRGHRVDRTPGHRDVLDPEQLDGLGDALDLLPAERGALKLPLEQAMAGVGTDHLTGDGHVFEPDGHVARLAHQRHGVRLGLDDGRPGMDADPGMQLGSRVGSADCSRAIVMPSRIASPARAARPAASSYATGNPKHASSPFSLHSHDRAAELLHRLLARLEKRPQHVRLILRVESQIRLGLEHVAATDQHGQLAALGLTGAPNRRGRPRVDGRWKWRRRRDVRPLASAHSASGVGGGSAGGGAGVTGVTGAAAVSITRCRSSAKSPAVVYRSCCALRECLQAGAFQVRRNVAHELTRRLRLILAHLPQQLHQVGRPERQTARQQLVQHDAQAIEVGAPVDAVRRALGLFGRHVVGRPQEEALLARTCLLFAQREAEVHQHRPALGREQDVRGFDVAVDDAPRVRMAQRIEHGQGDPRRVLPRRPMVVHPAAEVGPLEVIGDDIHGALVHADVVHGHDTGVVQLREPPRLLPRPFGVRPVSGPAV